MNDQAWFGRFQTARLVQVQAATVAGQPTVMPAVYQRGMERRSSGSQVDVVRRTQVTPVQYSAPTAGPPVGQPLPPGTRRVQVFPRGEVPLNFKWDFNPQNNQWTALIDGGVNLIVDGLKDGTIDVSPIAW